MLDYLECDDHKKIPVLVEMIEIFQKASAELNLVSIPQLPLELAVVKIAGPVVAKPASENDKQAPPPVETKPAAIDISKSEPKADERPHKSLEKGAIMFTLPSLQENWPRITERIKAPSLRLSLKNAVPVTLEQSELTIQFSTNFHRDKVMEHDHRVELESVIEELTGKPIKILSVVKELEIKTVVEEEKVVVKDNNLVDEALDIFGGEVVD